MKPVMNESFCWRPKVGDLIERSEVLRARGLNYYGVHIIIYIDSCEKAFGPGCKQDENCKYCLSLSTYDPVHGNETRGKHCFKNRDGEYWWQPARLSHEEGGL